MDIIPLHPFRCFQKFFWVDLYPRKIFIIDLQLLSINKKINKKKIYR